MKRITITALLFFTGLGYGQTIGVDPNFNGVTTGVPNGNIVYETTLQADGKILLGGELLQYNGQAVSGIVRLNEDGSIDPTFETGTGFLMSPGIARINCIAIAPEKKILVSGLFTSYNGTPCAGIVRLFENGAIDTTFTGPVFSNADSSTPNIIYDFVLDADGRIYIGGDFLLANQSTRALARLNSNGSLDTTFAGIAFNGHPMVLDVALNNSGNIIAGGALSYNNNGAGVLQINTNGTVNTAFFNNLSINGVAYHVYVQPDDKILYAGLYNEQGSYALLNRLNADGTPDESFTALMALVPDTGANRVSSINGYVGKTLVSGWGLSPDGNSLHQLLLLNDDGSVDSALDTAEGFYYPWFNAGILSMDIQPDNKIVAAGFFESYNSEPLNNITRLTGLTSGAVVVKENNDVMVYSNNGTLQFVSNNLPIVKVEIFGVEGRRLYSENLSSNTHQIDNLVNSLPLFGSIILKDGSIVGFKTMMKQ